MFTVNKARVGFVSYKRALTSKTDKRAVVRRTIHIRGGVVNKRNDQSSDNNPVEVPEHGETGLFKSAIVSC